VLGQTNQYRVAAVRGRAELLVSAPTGVIAAYPIAPPVAWHDDNAGPNDRGTLTPFATVHDRPLTFDVEPNDADYDGGPRQIVGFTNPAHGSLSLGPDGKFTYTPQSGFVGTDRFTYTVHDGSAVGPPARVAIDVTNAVPIAAAPDVSVYDRQPPDPGFYDDPITGRVAAGDGDGDALTYHVVQPVTRGTLTLDPATGAFTYVRGGAFEGADSFVFVANDGVAVGQPARVVIADHQRLAPVHSNDVQTHGAFLTAPGHYQVEYLVEPQHGTVSHAGGGGADGQSDAYVPDHGYTGLDFARYRLRHGDLVSKPVEVWFRVEPAGGGGTGQVLPPVPAGTYFGAEAGGPTSYAAAGTITLAATATPSRADVRGRGRRDRQARRRRRHAGRPDRRVEGRTPALRGRRRHRRRRQGPNRVSRRPRRARWCPPRGRRRRRAR
jgi:hypothetical protein